MQKTLEYLQANRDRYEEELFQWLRIPSISADSAYRGDCHKAAEWLAGELNRIGLKAELIETDGNPLVYAENEPVEGRTTVLIYGHYDVQPVDPVDLWETGPFEPTIRDGKLYARGSSDDKGQVMTHVKSVEAMLAAEGSLPVNVKFLIEGEEEIGSPSLGKYAQTPEGTKRLACDCIVVSDTNQLGPGKPAITCGLRGIQAVELFLEGPNKDLHSGSFGGSVMNPGNALCKIISALVDDEGRIQIPGFYDDVVELTDAEREQLASLPFDEEAYREQLGVDELFGEKDRTTLERRWTRPTLDINGLTCGYQGEGSKTIVPAKASAKISCRLVPNQDPEKIKEQIQKRVAEVCPPGVRCTVVDCHGASGMLVPLDSPYMAAAIGAIKDGFGIEPVMVREGGSIPIVALLSKVLESDALLLGWGQSDDAIHSPNERFTLDDYHLGIKTSACFWNQLSD
ncbi:MAG: dipeptidase [Planctomycetia bacterium]|jgi:succinyl-diaminopimelate desuccinylase